MIRWKVAFADGTILNVPKARGWRDAARRAWAQIGQMRPLDTIEKLTGGAVIYRRTTWRFR